MCGEAPNIFGTGEQIRDYIYVDDIADANIAALNIQYCGLFNIGTGLGTSVNELFRLLKEYLNSDFEPSYVTPRKGELEKTVLNNEKAEKLLGWKPKTKLAEGIAKTVCYFENRRNKQKLKEQVLSKLIGRDKANEGDDSGGRIGNKTKTAN